MTQQDSAPQPRSPQDVRYSPYEIAEALGLDARSDLTLPVYDEHEDFVEGTLRFGAVTLQIYYEYSLSYLALMSDDRRVLGDGPEC